MYGKFFASTFTGSMFGAGPDVFAVWGYVVANTVAGTVELNPPLLAAVLGTTPEQVSRAIDILSAEDPESRSPEEQGRRIVHDHAFTFRVINHAKYRAIRNEEERREYNKQSQRRHRAKSSGVIRPVNDGQSQSTPSAHTEAEAEKREDLSQARRSAILTEKYQASTTQDPPASPEIDCGKVVENADGRESIVAPDVRDRSEDLPPAESFPNAALGVVGSNQMPPGPRRPPPSPPRPTDSGNGSRQRIAETAARLAASYQPVETYAGSPSSPAQVALDAACRVMPAPGELPKDTYDALVWDALKGNDGACQHAYRIWALYPQHFELLNPRAPSADQRVKRLP